MPAEVFADADVRRLCKRLRRTGDHLFTFLDYPQIPFENNHAERQIRPAVVLRKNSQSNRSDRGARALQAALAVKLSNALVPLHALGAAGVGQSLHG